jgi:CheY-like chemotaxis protein
MRARSPAAAEARGILAIMGHGRILLVDDNPADLQLAEEMLDEAGLHPQVEHARDGIEAVRKLRAVADGAEPAPNLVLLDINMPRMNGFEVLSYIRREPRLAGVPVLMLTTSSRAGDTARARSLGAQDYLVKPDNVVDYIELVSGLSRYLSCAS